VTTGSPDPPQDPRVAALKRRIERRQYRIDSELVAREIIRKLRLIREARRLLSAADRSPPADARGRTDP
jgi:hypothetical protein